MATSMFDGTRSEIVRLPLADDDHVEMANPAAAERLDGLREDGHERPLVVTAVARGYEVDGRLSDPGERSRFA